jgi:hypothetical protein
MAASQARGSARPLVKTAFDRVGINGDALRAAHGLGVQVRIQNHYGGIYHLKLYIGSSGTKANAVIGSANIQRAQSVRAISASVEGRAVMALNDSVRGRVARVRSWQQGRVRLRTSRADWKAAGSL